MDLGGFLLTIFFVLFAYETSSKLKRIDDSIKALRQDIEQGRNSSLKKEKK